MRKTSSSGNKGGSAEGGILGKRNNLRDGDKEEAKLERHTEALSLLATLAGIAAVAYADGLVVSISLGYLYVLPLSLSALTQRLRATLVLTGICVVLHDWLGPYEHTDGRLPTAACLLPQAS